jgi:spermidine/putrescine transport system permease protein
MVGLMIPFWTNFVIRAFSIKFFFGDAGPVNELLQRIGWTTEPVAFANSDLTVWFGMVTNYLPFMVLPLYVVMEKLDFAVLEAARDLGASSLQVFWKVLVPLARKGTIAGITLVFPCALGEFVIPDLLGGAKTMLIGNLITDQFLKTRDWPFGASISVILFGVVLGALALQMRADAKREGDT